MTPDIPSAQGETVQDTEIASIGVRINRLEQELKRLDVIQQELEALLYNTPLSNKVVLILFLGELDKVLASLIISSTAASMGMEVEVFFTFWGINVLKEKRIIEHKAMLGAGAILLKRMMIEKDIISAHELLDVARESGVKLHVYSMTMQVLGIRKEELITDVEEVGAAAYVRNASRAGLTLFI